MTKAERAKRRPGDQEKTRHGRAEGRQDNKEKEEKGQSKNRPKKATQEKAKSYDWVSDWIHDWKRHFMLTGLQPVSGHLKGGRGPTRARGTHLFATGVPLSMCPDCMAFWQELYMNE